MTHLTDCGFSPADGATLALPPPGAEGNAYAGEAGVLGPGLAACRKLEKLILQGSIADGGLAAGPAAGPAAGVLPNLQELELRMHRSVQPVVQAGWCRLPVGLSCRSLPFVGASRNG